MWSFDNIYRYFRTAISISIVDKFFAIKFQILVNCFFTVHIFYFPSPNNTLLIVCLQKKDFPNIILCSFFLHYFLVLWKSSTSVNFLSLIQRFGSGLKLLDKDQYKNAIEIKVSIGIAPTRDCIHFLKIRFVVAGGGFYSYCIPQEKK